MLKSFTPVFIMLTAFITGLETPSIQVVSSIIVICLGTAFTCSFSPQLNIFGILVMMLAEWAEAIRLVLTQFLLQNLKFGVIEGQYVLAPASALWLFAASFITEFSQMRKDDAFTIILNNPIAFLAASCMGLLVNFLSYLVIQATSSLTMKVRGLTFIISLRCFDG